MLRLENYAVCQGLTLEPDTGFSNYGTATEKRTPLGSNLMQNFFFLAKYE